jgi:uncharacterized protein YukE
MPTYKVTDPDTGRTLSLTGDTPPTEAELEEIFGAYQEPTERERLEEEFAQAEKERQAAGEMLEASLDTPLENLAEGIQEFSAGGVGAAADVATFVASPLTYAYELATGQDVPTGREALAMIDPRIDPNRQFVEERGVATAPRLAGELTTMGAGFAQVARDPSKVASALQDIVGLGMTKAPVVAPTAVAAKKVRDFDLTSEEGLMDFADDAAIRFDVEEARPKFESYERWEAEELPAYEKKMKDLGEQWDKAASKINDADERLAKAVESGNEVRIEKAQDNLSVAENKLAEIETRIEKAPEAPKIEATTAQRRDFVKEELRSAGVSEDVIKQVVIPQRYRKPKPFEELMQYDVSAMRGAYDVKAGAASNILERFARPVSALVSKFAGPRVGVLFESSFETAGRKQELFLNKYYSEDTKDSFAELVDWSNNDNIKRLFLDLNKAPEKLEQILREGSSMSKEANALLRKLVVDSKAHQKESGKIFKEEVQQDFAEEADQTVEVSNVMASYLNTIRKTALK